MASQALRGFRCRGAAMLAASALALSAGAVQAAVEISSKPTQNMSCQAGVCSPTASKAVLNVADLAAMLGSGDAAIKSTSQNPDIEIDAALNWTSPHRLMLDSYHAIAFNKPVVVAGTGAMTIATNDGGTGGDYRFFGKGHVEFWDTASKLIINGQSYNLVKGIKDINRNGGGYAALAKSFSLKRKIYSKAPIKSVNVLEGLGNTISDLTIDAEPSEDFVGLVGTCNFGSVIRDMRLESVDIQAVDHAAAGSLVGENSGSILNSYATGKIRVSDSAGGGLVGLNHDGTISQSYSSDSVTGSEGSVVGGLVGYNIGSCNGACGALVDRSFATGATSGDDSVIAGGLIGVNLGGTISNSYALGAVTGGSGTVAGGLIGVNGDNGDDVPVLDSSYSTGSVSGGAEATIGGLIGQNADDASSSDTYWDVDTSGQANGVGSGGATGIVGLTTQQFTSGLPAGFDKKVWKEKAGGNGGYPWLIDLPPG